MSVKACGTGHPSNNDHRPAKNRANIDDKGSIINTIQNMDCIEGLKQIEDSSTMLVFADPPYNIIGLDIFVDINNYRKWVKEWINQIRRILKYNGTLIVCGRPPILCYILYDITEMGFIFREWITWHKTDSITPAKTYHSNNYECFAIFSNWSDRVFNHIPTVSKSQNYGNERNIGSIWEHCKISSHHKEGTKHPTQKPINFLDRMIRTYTNEGDLVCDPFMGSGTTAVACKQLNRNFVGFETNLEYCKMSEERLKNVVGRLDKFV